MATWHFVANQTPATGAVAVYDIVTAMLAAGWLKKSDSDGTTYSASGTQVTGGGSGANGLGNASAWVRMQDPGGGAEFCIQRGASNTQWRVTYSPSAKFVTGSPGATQVPSASDSWVDLGSGTDGAPGFAAWFAADGGYRFSAAARSDAVTVNAVARYAVFSFAFPSGGGEPNHAFDYDPTDPVLSAVFNGYDTVDPVIHYLDTGGGSWETNFEGGIAQGKSPSVVVPISTRAPFNVRSLKTDPSTGKDYAITALFSAVSGVSRAVKGFATNFYYHLTGDIATPRPTPTAVSSATSNDRVVVGYVNLPWDGSNPLV